MRLSSPIFKQFANNLDQYTQKWKDKRQKQKQSYNERKKNSNKNNSLFKITCLNRECSDCGSKQSQIVWRSVRYFFFHYVKTFWYLTTFTVQRAILDIFWDKHFRVYFFVFWSASKKKPIFKQFANKTPLSDK
jgi:hypothetical protein